MAASAKFVITPRTNNPAVRLIRATKRIREHADGLCAPNQLVPGASTRPGGDARHSSDKPFGAVRISGPPPPA